MSTFRSCRSSAVMQSAVADRHPGDEILGFADARRVRPRADARPKCSEPQDGDRASIGNVTKKPPNETATSSVVDRDTLAAHCEDEIRTVGSWSASSYVRPGAAAAERWVGMPWSRTVGRRATIFKRTRAGAAWRRARNGSRRRLLSGSRS